MEPANKITDVDQVPLTALEQGSSYWRLQFERQRRLHDAGTERIILGQLFTLVVMMAAGMFIEQNKSALLLVGTTFILYPVLAELLSSSAAVLTAGLHHEIDTLEGSKLKITLWSVARSLLVIIAACACVGALTGLIGVVLFDASFLKTLILAIAAGSLTGLVALPLMAVVLFVVRLMQVNPDDVTPPLETTVCHAVTLLSIVVVSRFIT